MTPHPAAPQMDSRGELYTRGVSSDTLIPDLVLPGVSMYLRSPKSNSLSFPTARFFPSIRNNEEVYNRLSASPLLYSFLHPEKGVPTIFKDSLVTGSVNRKYNTSIINDAQAPALLLMFMAISVSCSLLIQNPSWIWLNTSSNFELTSRRLPPPEDCFPTPLLSLSLSPPRASKCGRYLAVVS